jgi:serine protease Do
MPDFTVLVRQVGPAVVNVTTSSTPSRAAALPSMPGQGPGDPLFEFFRRFLPPDEGGREFRRQGLGSGFVIDAEGYVLTNAHVVAEADEVLVRLADSKRAYKAKVVGTDRQTDIALLKVEARGLPVAPLGDSQQLQPGQWVAAIGSPFGFANTITAGIVSATQRSLPNETYVPFIQTDVAVNPGNSGGPLLNLQGQVVGINSQIYSRTGGYMGVSFAIPIAMAMDVARQLRERGHVTRGRLGVGIQEVSEDLARSFGLSEARGALITSVERGSPAQRAGLLVGDIVTSFNGEAIGSLEQLPRRVAQTPPGTEVKLEVWREGASRTLTLTMGEQRDTAREPPPPEGAGPQAPGSGRLGLAVSELPPAGRRALGVDYGLVVQRVQGPNAEAPLQQGDVIVAINGRRFSSLEEFNRQVAELAQGGRVALLVRRGDASLYVPMEVGPA